MGWQLCRARGRVRFCDCENVLCCRTWWLRIMKFDLPKQAHEWAHLAHLRSRRRRKLSLLLSYGFSARISIHAARLAKPAAFGA